MLGKAGNVRPMLANVRRDEDHNGQRLTKYGPNPSRVRAKRGRSRARTKCRNISPRTPGTMHVICSGDLCKSLGRSAVRGFAQIRGRSGRGVATSEHPTCATQNTLKVATGHLGRPARSMLGGRLDAKNRRQQHAVAGVAPHVVGEKNTSAGPRWPRATNTRMGADGLWILGDNITPIRYKSWSPYHRAFGHAKTTQASSIASRSCAFLRSLAVPHKCVCVCVLQDVSRDVARRSRSHRDGRRNRHIVDQSVPYIGQPRKYYSSAAPCGPPSSFEVKPATVQVEIGHTLG